MLQNLPQRGAFFDTVQWRFAVALPNIASLPAATHSPLWHARVVGDFCGQNAVFRSMKRNPPASALAALFGVLCASLMGPAWGRAPWPVSAPPATLQGSAPTAPVAEQAPEAARGLRGEAQSGTGQGGWRNLTPEQREAIRRLSREQREALINRTDPRRGAAPSPGARLSPQERRQLREQIREAHELRGAGFGRGRRP